MYERSIFSFHGTLRKFFEVTKLIIKMEEMKHHVLT